MNDGKPVETNRMVKQHHTDNQRKIIEIRTRIGGVKLIDKKNGSIYIYSKYHKAQSVIMVLAEDDRKDGEKKKENIHRSGIPGANEKKI